MKIFLYIIALFLGIVIFRVGYVVLDEYKENRAITVSEQDFWYKNIYIKDMNKNLEFTPQYFFKSIPNLDVYPDNKIIYFKVTDSIIKGKDIIITALVIQENKVLYRNRFYFELGQKLNLVKIISEDLIFESISTIATYEELFSLMTTYKGFVDLWLLYDLEK